MIHRTTWRRRSRRGAALLEVVLAISILVLAMSVVGIAFRGGHHNAELAERMSRAAIMTEQLLCELDLGMMNFVDGEQSGYFGDHAEPGMAWKMEVQPYDQVPGLARVAVTIYMGDPEAEDREKQSILSTYVLRAVPQKIDFQKDFGFDEDQIQQITEAIPGGEAVFDPKAFDPTSIAKLPLDTLVELLPALIQAFGGGLVAGNIDQIMDMAQRGDMSGLQKFAQQAATAQPGLGAGLPAGPGSGAPPSGSPPPSKQPSGSPRPGSNPPPPQPKRGR